MHYDDGHPLPVYSSTLFGQYTAPLTKTIGGTTQVLVVDFTATGLHNLSGLPLTELVGCNEDAGLVLGFA